LNLLPTVFGSEPLEAMPPLIGGNILLEDSVFSVEGGRIGVGAGVSVQTVAGEELGEGSASRNSFCWVVLFGIGTSREEEEAIAD
jgi:hypothetical protein